MLTHHKMSYKKPLLVALVLAVILTAFPLTSALAEGLNQSGNPQGDNTRLEAIWARQLAAYNKAETRLAKSNEFIVRVKDFIKKANDKGLDTSSLQAALDAFQSAVQDARPLLNSANGIITSHKGFDDNGKVTDRAQAVETVKELGQHLKDTRSAMNGTGRALQEALKAFREANRPPQPPPTKP